MDALRKGLIIKSEEIMSLAEGLRSLGLLGVFLASFIGHFSIVLKDVLFLPVFFYISNFLDPFPLGLVGGIGGGLGELGAYLMGRGIGKFAANKQEETTIPKWTKKLGLFSVLIFSLTPLPDTPVLMLLGSVHFPILAVLVLEIIGKTFLYTSVAVAGGILYSNLSGIFPAPWSSVIITSASLGLSVLVSWKRTRTRILRFAQKILNKIGRLSKRENLEGSH
jgi:membrane protein YqaA with SNARE-associated domain